MKKFRFIFSVIYLFFFVALYSCKKPACPPPEEPTPFEYLTEDSWKVEKFEDYVNGNLVRLNPGDPDERFVFSPSKDYFYFDYYGNLQDYGRFEFYPGNPTTIGLYLVYNRNYQLIVTKLTEDTLHYQITVFRNGQTHLWKYYLYR